MENRYPCPCCGCATLESRKPEYEVCPVCGWEDDPVQRRDPDFAGGANRLSLNESRANYLRIGACEERLLPFVRAPYATESDDSCTVELFDEDAAPTEADEDCIVEIFVDETEPENDDGDIEIEIFADDGEPEPDDDSCRVEIFEVEE